MKFGRLALLLLPSAQALSATPSLTLEQQLQALMAEVRQLRGEVQQLRAERRAPVTTVDLAATEVAPSALARVPPQANTHVLAKPWWHNIEFSGFAAAGAYHTGKDATRAEGGFEIKEASLFVAASVWEDTDLFLELQTNRLGKDDSLLVRTGEVYIHLRNLALGQHRLGLKLGRIDLPFGEEYLWQDAHQNPLITNSAAYPYGWDEGLLVYGDFNQWHWIFAVTDGTDQRSFEDHADKAFNLKVYGEPTPNLYLSASAMQNGAAGKSAIEFGGSHFESVADSPRVDAQLFEVDAKLTFQWGERDGYLAAALGAAKQDDPLADLDRDLRWLSIEPYLRLAPHWYTALRYSEIGTYDSRAGFHFDGKTFAGGNSAFGFDVQRFRRLGLGVGWTPHPRLTAKLEVGHDWFDLIETSNRRDGNSRHFIGAEMAVGF